MLYSSLLKITLFPSLVMQISFYSEILSYSLIVIKSLKIQKRQKKVHGSQKLCQTCNIISVTFKQYNLALLSNYYNRNTNIPYINYSLDFCFTICCQWDTLKCLTLTEKRFKKNILWMKKIIRSTPVPLCGVGMRNITIKQKFIPFFQRAFSEQLYLDLLCFKQDFSNQFQI